jgi:hypothetical protein
VQGDLIRADATGRTIIQLAIDHWVFDQLLQFDEGCEDFGDNGGAYSGLSSSRANYSVRLTSCCASRRRPRACIARRLISARNSGDIALPVRSLAPLRPYVRRHPVLVVLRARRRTELDSSDPPHMAAVVEPETLVKALLRSAQR